LIVDHLISNFPALKEKVLFNQIEQGVNITFVEEAFIPHKYGMEVTGQCDPKLVLAFNFFFLVFVVSFSNHFQFFVFFVSIYIILLLDFFI
jgi:hypothetical protein